MNKADIKEAFWMVLGGSSLMQAGTFDWFNSYSGLFWGIGLMALGILAIMAYGRQTARMAHDTDKHSDCCNLSLVK